MRLLRNPIKIRTDTERNPQVTPRPTTDPHASMALADAIEDTATLARRPAALWSARFSAPHHSEPRLQAVFTRLETLARSLGYTVRLQSIAHEQGPYMQLRGDTTGWPTLLIRLDNGLPAVLTLSTFCHEIAHVLLGHQPNNKREHRRMTMAGVPYSEDPAQEAACELAAAAVMRAAGLGDGSSQAAFIAEKMGSQPVPQHVKDAANLAARILYAAVFEGQPAYAAA